MSIRRPLHTRQDTHPIIMIEAKYYIYRNLHTKGFSIKYRGKVVDRGNCFFGENVTFKVSELGRQRVITDTQKNVHAYAVCDKYYHAGAVQTGSDDKIISYNPYKVGNFIYNGKKIETADVVLFTAGKCYLHE